MPRKATGTLVKTKSGLWQGIVRFTDGNRRRLPPFPAGTSEAFAKERTLAAQERIIREGLCPTISTKVTAGSTVDQWFDLWAQHRESKGYTSTVNDRGRYRLHIAPTIGERPIANVTRHQIETIVTHLDQLVRAEEMSWKTAQNTWGVLTKMFSDAQQSKVPGLRVRADNPTTNVQAPDRGTKKSKTYLYPSEFLSLMACSEAPLHWRRRIAVAVYLGARAGELDALQWQDLDLARGVAHVRRSLDRSRGNIEKTTKTGEVRHFKIEPTLLPLLETMHREASPEASDRVFAPLNATSYSGRLRELLIRAGVDRPELHSSNLNAKQICWHDLRATSATWRAVRADTAAQISNALGHSNYQTTMLYIREASGVAEGFGDVFPELPDCLLSVRPESSHPAEDLETHDLDEVSAEQSGIFPAEIVASALRLGVQVPLGSPRFRAVSRTVQ